MKNFREITQIHEFVRFHGIFQNHNPPFGFSGTIGETLATFGTAGLIVNVPLRNPSFIEGEFSKDPKGIIGEDDDDNSSCF